MNNSPAYRHCAACLVLITTKPVLVCGKCNQRAYCSKQCQVVDWKVGLLQGHQKWCGLGVGEEDIDWEVVEYGSKGLGLRAKRNFKLYDRIMVDGFRKIGDPVIEDLMPLGGSLADKMNLNRLGGGGQSMLCARIARANHSCDPNATHMFDPTYHVKVLVALKEIKCGDEIVISYAPYWDAPSSGIPPEMASEMLENNWGIRCDVNCRCQNLGFLKVAKDIRKWDSIVVSEGSKREISSGLHATDMLLSLFTENNASPNAIIRTYFDRFQIAIMSSKTLSSGVKDLEKAIEINSALVHPSSEENLSWKNLAANPSLHFNYLIVDHGKYESPKYRRFPRKR